MSLSQVTWYLCSSVSTSVDNNIYSVYFPGFLGENTEMCTGKALRTVKIKCKLLQELLMLIVLIAYKADIFVYV